MHCTPEHFLHCRVVGFVIRQALHTLYCCDFVQETGQGPLKRGTTTILQLNVGLYCNQVRQHVQPDVALLLKAALTLLRNGDYNASDDSVYCMSGHRRALYKPWAPHRLHLLALLQPSHPVLLPFCYSSLFPLDMRADNSCPTVNALLQACSYCHVAAGVCSPVTALLLQFHVPSRHQHVC